MALTTASLPELREKSSADIVAVSAELREAAFPSRKEERNAERRLDRYMEKRLLIENASSKFEQIDSYGAKQWGERFVRLAQISVPEGCKLSEAELREAVWRAIPQGRFKRFQELFCDPHNYVVPRFTVKRDGQISFIGNPDFSKVSMAGCLVSIDRIPDELCEKIKLVEFTEKERGSPLLRFMRKADVAVINRLKRIWDCCEAISTHDFRVFIIQRPMSEAWNRYPKTGPFPNGLHGSAFFLHHDTSDRISKKNPPLGPKYANARRLSYFDDIYYAYRKTLHEGYGYEVERKELVPLKTKLRMGRQRIDTEWKKGAPQDQKDSVREQVEKTLTEGGKTLRHDVNRHKVRAVELMGNAVHSRDKTGRLNPRGTSLRMERTERHLGSRLGEMRAKQRHNQTDEALLNEIIDAHETVLDQFRIVLAENADAVMLPKRHTPTRSTVAVVRTAKPEEVLRRLVPDRQALNTIGAQPLSIFAGLLRVGCDQLEGALNQKRIKVAEQAVVKMHIVSKLFAAKLSLERMKDQLVDPERVPVEYLKREVSGISLILEHRILNGVQVDDYEKPFLALTKQVQGLHQVLELAPEPHASAQERKDYFTQLKRTFDAIEPETLAWELVPEKWRKASGQHAPAAAT